MARHHQFYYAGPPPLAEYVPTAITAAMAMGLTAAAFAMVWTPSGRTGSALDDYGIIVIAAAAWALPAIFGLALVRRIRAYRSAEPALAVDDDGLTLRGLSGKPRDLKWSQVTGLGLEQRRGRFAARIIAGSVSGAVPLHGLDSDPPDVWDVVRRCRERASA